MAPIAAGRLFDSPSSDRPEGFRYHPEAITAGQERTLLEHIRQLSFGSVTMRGVTARRRVVQFGWRYQFDAHALTPGPDVPEFLEPLQCTAGALAGVDPGDLSEVLVTEYPPGATIGWHRDAPPFGVVVGVSLLGACRFRFKRTRPEGTDRVSLELEPRSAYVLAGPARREWQHSIPPTPTLRYSITFRTLRSRAGPATTRGPASRD